MSNTTTKYQTIVVTTSEGKRCVYTGLIQLGKGDKIEKVDILEPETTKSPQHESH